MSGGRPRAPGPRSFELLELVARLDVAAVEALQCAFAVSRRGRKHLALPTGEVPTGAQYGLGLRHSQAVSWVAALLELRGRAWVSDREARGRPDWQMPVMWPASRGTHRPD